MVSPSDEIADRKYAVPGRVAPERGVIVLVKEIDLAVIRAGNDVLAVCRDGDRVDTGVSSVIPLWLLGICPSGHQNQREAAK